MNRKIKDSEIVALLSADEAGQIVIPCGSAMEIEAFVKTMLSLEIAGFVSRNEGTKFYRPFVLTDKGKALAETLAGNGAKPATDGAADIKPLPVLPSASPAGA